MLVLSRTREQQIVIDGNIVVTVVEVRGDKVRLGIDAPKEIPVHRREVYDAIQRQLKEAQNQAEQKESPTEETPAEESTGN